MSVAELERQEASAGKKSRYRIVDADQHVDPPHTFLNFPHSETTFPNPSDAIEEEFAGIPEEDVPEIVGGRAARLFQFNN